MSTDRLLRPYPYWPNYGFEPYWAGGDHMFRDPVLDLRPGETTTKIPLVCGEECNFMAMRVKEVCGQHTNHYQFGRCWYGECNGEVLKDLTSRYRTFATYCEFLAEQCRAPKYRWVFLHRGPCIRPFDVYMKRLMPREAIVTRTIDYLTKYEETLDRLFDRKKTTVVISSMLTPAGN